MLLWWVLPEVAAGAAALGLFAATALMPAAPGGARARQQLEKEGEAIAGGASASCAAKVAAQAQAMARLLALRARLA